MPPKKPGGKDAGRETPQALSEPRPKTPNDRALAETEQGLTGLRDTKKKWEERQRLAAEVLKRNEEAITVINDALSSCERMLRELDGGCSRLLVSKAEQELQESAPAADAKGGGKKGGAPKAAAEPAADTQRLDEAKLVTDVLLRYYRFDPPKDEAAELLLPQPRIVCGAPLPPSGDEVPELAKHAKAEAQRDFDARREEEEPAGSAAAGKPAPKRPGGSAGKSKTPGQPPPEPVEDARPVTPEVPPPLPAPRGIDKAAWQEVLRLRGKRLQVDQAIEHLKKELVPLQVRRQGLESMVALTEYANDATRCSTTKLTEKRGQQKEVESKEVNAYAEEQRQKQQQLDDQGGAGKKKK